MMNKWRVGVLVALLVASTVAYSAVALALLIEPAANFVGGLVLRSLGRQVIVSVGVAANDASWLVSTANLVARAVGILKIAGSAFEYEIPTLPGSPIPAPVPATPASGAPGTYYNPYPYTQAGIKPKITSTAPCLLNANESVDGIAHALTVKTYDSWDELLSACAAVQSFSMFAAQRVPPEYFLDSGVEPVAATLSGVTVYVQPVRLRYAESAKDPESYTWARLGYGGFSVAYLEAPDSVKRFIRTAEGFKPDTADPDWTTEEKAAFSAPGVIQFRSAESVVNVSATAQSTKIQAATQAATDVRYRDVVLNADAVPTASSEQLVKNASVGDVLASETSTGSGTDIEFPSDYARQGEAATAAAAVTNKLDTLHEDLTKAGEAPADVIAPDASTFEDSFFKGAFADLLEWDLPSHTSTCPTAAINFDFFGQPFNVNMNAQCVILADPTVSNTAQTAFVVLWILVALFLVLGA